MKTALQQAIEQIQQKIAECPEFDNERGAYLTCKAILTALLPTERDVINEAYDNGYWDSERMAAQDKDYFTTKFNNDDKDN